MSEELNSIPVQPEEKEYRYQPKDEQGRPIGGAQVIKYKTETELVEKITANHEQAIRQLRKVTRDNRLGIQPVETIPQDAERLGELVELKPKELSAEERFEISQQLNDPENFGKARDRLLESALGVPVAEFAQKFNQQQILTMQLAARDNYLLFIQNNREVYFDCAENRETMTDWMWKNRLAPTVNNFVLASQQLREAGLLLSAPAVQRVTEPTPAKEVVPVESVSNPQTPVVPTPRIEGGNGGNVDPYAELTMFDIDQMPAGEYRQKLNDPKFRAHVDELMGVKAPASAAEPQAKRPVIQVPSGLTENNSSASNGSVTPTSNANGLPTLAEIDRMPADEYARRLRDPKFREHVDKLEAAAIQARKTAGYR